MLRTDGTLLALNPAPKSSILPSWHTSCLQLCEPPSVMDRLLPSLRYTIRSLLRSPGFAMACVLILGFGIGLNTAIFSLINAVILRPLPYPNPDRLVRVCEPYQSDLSMGFDYPDFIDTVATQHSFESLAVADRDYSLDLSGNGQPEHLEVEFVSPSMFKVSGLPTVVGRVFTEQEDIPNGPLLVVLSEHFWRTRFQSDPKIIGKNLTLSDQSFQVIGVVPTQVNDWGPPSADVYLPANTIAPPGSSRRSWLSACASGPPSFLLCRSVEDRNQRC